jgi:hypothetical protein
MKPVERLIDVRARGFGRCHAHVWGVIVTVFARGRRFRMLQKSAKKPDACGRNTNTKRPQKHPHQVFSVSLFQDIEICDA